MFMCPSSYSRHVAAVQLILAPLSRPIDGRGLVFVQFQPSALHLALYSPLLTRRRKRPEEALQMVEQALRHKPAVVDEHLGSIGGAYYLAGRPEDAVAPLKQYLTRYPNILGAHLGLAAAYSELGKDAEARAEAAEVLRINPNYSLEVARQRSPLKDPVRLEQELAILRKAGLK
jgi:predicted Zn-dependent protease